MNGILGCRDGSRFSIKETEGQDQGKGNEEERDLIEKATEKCDAMNGE